MQFIAFVSALGRGVQAGTWQLTLTGNERVRVRISGSQKSPPGFPRRDDPSRLRTQTPG